MYTTVNGENIFVRNKRDCIDIIRAGINDDMANYIESLLNDADCSEEQLCKVNDDMESINKGVNIMKRYNKTNERKMAIIETIFVVIGIVGVFLMFTGASALDAIVERHVQLNESMAWGQLIVGFVFMAMGIIVNSD